MFLKLAPEGRPTIHKDKNNGLQIEEGVHSSHCEGDPVATEADVWPHTASSNVFLSNKILDPAVATVGQIDRMSGQEIHFCIVE